ncbi:tetratricopeptide repeat protein [Stieleria sp. TO1_6]|uniref:tetratricopeptide repeat protein n=1 Tax=Stieleria tagensis TaxID=2956795 RepID=UPI00209B4B84|nr:tetratricopeptide repeat protein [Stieleria tagensis]MCO8121543.1 tetratricopeptide repeat protein [Stieleria tagensis]
MESESTTEIQALLDKAIESHRQGQLTHAEWGYEEVLEKDPQQPDALQLLGVIAAQMGNTALAIERVNQSIAVNPNQPGALNNLGNMLAEEERNEEAMDAYRRAIELKPEYAQAYHNLGNVLSECDQMDAAIDAYSQATQLQPDDAQYWSALGTAQEQAADWDNAIVAYQRALAIDPQRVAVLSRMGATYRKMQRLDDARKIYQQWLELVPEDPVATHLMLACSATDQSPDRASVEYVQRTFDQFAHHFDEQLSKLDYQTPQRIGEIISQQVAETKLKLLSVADLGCGTGLCGPYLRPMAQQLIGIDLSENMLAEARQRELYDELLQRDLTEYLTDCPDQHDLLVSADTLIYVGELLSTFAAAAKSLRPGGLFVFSIETPETDAPYRLAPSGRYQHSQTYVKESLRESGLEVRQCVEADIRMEGHETVNGFIVVAQRPISPALPSAQRQDAENQ